jgi:hypothetical protein
MRVLHYRRRVLGTTHVTAVFLSLAGCSAWGQTYTFSKIAEASDPLVYFSYLPSVSDTGAVAYNMTTVTPNPPALTPLTQSGAFVNENGLIRRLGDPKLVSLVSDINSSGTILFLQSDPTGAPQLLLDMGGSTTEVSSAATGDFASFGFSVDGGSSLNDKGDVAFLAAKDVGTIGVYLRTADGSISTVIEQTLSGAPPVQFGPRINNHRTITFAYGADAYYLAAGASPVDIAVSSPELSSSSASLSNVALNNSDIAVLIVNGLASKLPGGAILESVGGAATQVIIHGTGSVPGDVYAATINDAGAIAYFKAPDISTPGSTYSIQYAADGKTPQPVISSRDSLFGGTVSQLGDFAKVSTGRYLNSSGQIAFLYSLTDGRHGVALATPAK